MEYGPPIGHGLHDGCYDKQKQLELQVGELQRQLADPTRKTPESWPYGGLSWEKLAKHAEEGWKLSAHWTGEAKNMERLIGVLRTQLKGAVFFIHLDCHGGASFDQCKAPVCANANEVLGNLVERPNNAWTAEDVSKLHENAGKLAKDLDLPKPEKRIEPSQNEHCATGDCIWSMVGMCKCPCAKCRVAH